MSKELWIAAHEQLIEEYLLKHPTASDAEASANTVDEVQDRFANNLGGMIDAARQRAKDHS